MIYSPTALSATNIVDTSFKALWNVEPTASRYYLEIATDENFTNKIDNFGDHSRHTKNGYRFDTKFDTTIIVSFDIEAIDNLRTYYYRLRSEGVIGNLSPYSNYRKVRLPSTVPSIPVVLEPTYVTE